MGGVKISSMKVLLGMSGGVDSSMAVVYLQRQGYEVIGTSFRFTDDDSSLRDAENLARKMRICHYTIDVRDQFRKTVIDYFVSEYLSGRTPFPCAKCNNELKWNLIFDNADRLGCEKVAMGHYVNIVEEGGLLFVSEGKDETKDQSFFLWGLSQSHLQRIVFPLGNCIKSEVKQEAEKLGFYSLKNKKESMGACFCMGDYRPFLRLQVKNPEKYFCRGNFLDETGNILGTHNGYPLFTIGQRRGLGLQLNRAMFVKEIRPQTNEVVVTRLEKMYRSGFYAIDYNLVSPTLFSADFDVSVRIRYRKQNTQGRIRILDSKLLKVELKEPLESIAPGQTAVFYRDGKVLGGAFIK